MSVVLVFKEMLTETIAYVEFCVFIPDGKAGGELGHRLLSCPLLTEMVKVNASSLICP